MSASFCNRMSDSSGDSLPGSARRLGAALGLALLAVAVSVVERTADKGFCSLSAYVDCQRVASSGYGAWFGIPLGTVSAGAHLVLAAWCAAALRLPHLRRALLPPLGGLALLFLLTSLVYAALSHLVVGGLCLLCTAIQVTDLALALLLAGPALRAGAASLRRDALRLAAVLAVHVLVLTGLAETAFARYGASAARFDPEADLARPIDVAGSPVLGDPDAPVQVVLFLDFGCPHCRATYEMARRALRHYPGRACFFVKHFPLDACNQGQELHPGACDAAYAMQAAAARGGDDEAMEYLFQQNRYFPDEVLEKLGRRMGVPAERWRALVASGEVRAIVERDMKDGHDLGLLGVPAVFIDGRAIPYGSFADRLQQVLRKR
ncbi:MAG: thioredoxin domain-containing protein [Planctomycetota bacterium]